MSKPKFKRLPNGFGAIVHLKGKRRKPWNARTPQMGLSETCCPIAFSLGCYETWQQAYDAIVKWHEKNDPEHYAPRLTFAECYKRMIETETESGQLAGNTVKSYAGAYKKLQPLHAKPVAEIRPAEIQRIIDEASGGYAALNTMKSVMRKVMRYALGQGLIDTDPSAYVAIHRRQETVKADKFFTWDELGILKQKAEAGDDFAALVLVMCYTGFRPAAYETLRIEDGCLVGGIKTESSKHRYVPIHPAIQKYVDERINAPYKRLVVAFRLNLKLMGFRPLTPHATRHTFKALCDMGGVDPIAARMLMGRPAGKDVHDIVYSHRTIDDLRREIEKIPW